MSTRALWRSSRPCKRLVDGCMTSLKTLLGRLVQQDVDFVVIGAYASVVHGATLVTHDVDICCSFTSRNLLKLQTALADLHPIHRLTPKQVALALTPAQTRDLKNLYLKTDLGVIDCLGEVLGVGNYAAVKRQSVIIEMEFGKCRVLGLEALIQAKRAMNRPRDRHALVQLEAIRTRQRRRD
jgi:hypothetical protein